MAYQAWSVVFGEQPSAAKWNILGTNDAYFDSLIGSGTAWASWTPSYVNITVGDGTVVAKYQQLGKTIFFHWQLVCGTTTAIGNSNTISLPVTANSRYGTANTLNPIGSVGAADVGTANWAGVLNIEASTTVCFPRWYSATPSSLTGTFPFTEASGDTYSISGRYEVA